MKINNFFKSRFPLSCLGTVIFAVGFCVTMNSDVIHWVWVMLSLWLTVFSLILTYLFYLEFRRERKAEETSNDEYNLFLDDERIPLDCATYMSSFKVDCKIYHQPWEIVRSYSQFKEIIERKGLPNLISFDHDLADNWKLRESLDPKEWFDAKENREYTGMDCAKWLVQYCEEKDFLLPKFVVHSANPVGRENIKSYLNNFQLRQGLEINGIKWEWKEDLKDSYLWNANWYSLDGDGIRLYINKDQTGFSLECFSGIPASSINIDSIDYGNLWYKATFIESISDYTYIQQSVILANYLCQKFCEKSNF